MGAVFYEMEYGEDAESVFKKLTEECRKYNGTIHSGGIGMKNDFIMLEFEEDKESLDNFIERHTEENDESGPAYCLEFKNVRTANINITNGVSVKNFPVEGARKWVTWYRAEPSAKYSSNGNMRVKEFKLKSDAVEYGREQSEKHGIVVNINIVKLLDNGDTLSASIEPKFKKGTKELNQYHFFGLASS